MICVIEVEQEDDGRWIADVPDLPGVMMYGATEEEAIRKCEVLALRVFADSLERDEARPEAFAISIEKVSNR